MILFFIAGVLLLQAVFAVRLPTEGLEIKFFIAGMLLLKGSLYRGFSVFAVFAVKIQNQFFGHI
jgi:hypothetical protein